MEKPTVAAVLIDIRASSRHPERERLQRELIRCRDALNEAFRPSLTIGFDVVAGDELEGVLADPPRVWDLYSAAGRLLGDVEFYMAVGIGTLTTPERPAFDFPVAHADGAAFKTAREALEGLKREARPVPCRLAFGVAGRPELATVLNAFVTVINDVLRNLTPTQRAYFLKVQELGTHEAAARAAGVTRTAVTMALRKGGWQSYEAAVTGLRALLAALAEWGPGGRRQ